MKVDLDKIKKLPPDIRDKFYKIYLLNEKKKKESKMRDDFLSFVKHVWPDFVEGYHHKIIAQKFNDLASGKIKRLIVNMPPRHTKSEFASYILPAWMVGRNPKLKIIQTTHTAELAVRFGRKAKSLLDSSEYQQIFSTRLREDSQAAGRWETAQGGEYFAAGVGGAITGRGADLLIIDDPHSEQDSMNMGALERAYEWYTSGPRQRLQPGGSIVVVMTRWNTKDLTGALIRTVVRSSCSLMQLKNVTSSLNYGAWLKNNTITGNLKQFWSRPKHQGSRSLTNYVRWVSLF
jgi:hypothetical protein